jgi:cytochrome c oxidase cbb3-type subunit 3
LTAGKKVFEDNCAACHGADAKGSTDVGAPDLTDGFWLYGGDEASIYASVYDGR